jgi:hypothetical protein
MASMEKPTSLFAGPAGFAAHAARIAAPAKKALSMSTANAQLGPLCADPQEIAHTLATLCTPGDLVELRIPKTPQGNGVGYFNDLQKLAAEMARLNGKGPGVYVTLNQLKRELLNRAPNHVEFGIPATKDDDIVRRLWLLIDFDPKRLQDVSSTDAEHEAALELARVVRRALRKEGWPEPILADSGNGAHLLYPIDLPNDDDVKNLLRNVLKALARLFNNDVVTIDPTVYNAARIVKAYGTIAAKGVPTAERPHRLSRILEMPE